MKTFGELLLEIQEARKPLEDRRDVLLYDLYTNGHAVKRIIVNHLAGEVNLLTE